MKSYFAAISSALSQPPLISTAQLLLHLIGTGSTQTTTGVMKAKKKQIRERNIARVLSYTPVLHIYTELLCGWWLVWRSHTLRIEEASSRGTATSTITYVRTRTRWLQSIDHTHAFSYHGNIICVQLWR